MQSAATGTWFPSGFHGSFLSKFRNDFVQEYRRTAKPHPPDKFIQRLKVNLVICISFSLSPCSDECCAVLGFTPQTPLKTFWSTGFGRRKVKNSPKQTGICNRDLITWVPLQEELTRQRPPISTYRADFWSPNSPRKFPQPLVSHTTRTTMGMLPLLTTYQYYHNSDQLNPNFSADILTAQIHRNPFEKEVSYTCLEGLPQTMTRLNRAQS
nr:PREDICTED: uncharacterized protein C3orf84-like [Latimeria chalumnae]|eukprot:XP_006006329.1 PREDICTED: uncharacterized protein C3orf84-like [Latimeria chalumnae]